MRNQSQKILSVILAAMTSMSPVMTYAAEAEEIQSNTVENSNITGDNEKA